MIEELIVSILGLSLIGITGVGIYLGYQKLFPQEIHSNESVKGNEN